MLEKHKCVVDGIEGWETVVTFRERLLPIAKYREPRDAMAIVARDLFFDYQGMTWQISIYCEKELYEKQAKNDFEGILHSFKFSE